MQFKGKEISKEMLMAADECKTAEELIKLAEENGFELTAEEAEAFLDENEDIELDEDMLDQASGGGDTCWEDCPRYCRGKSTCSSYDNITGPCE